MLAAKELHFPRTVMDQKMTAVLKALHRKEKGPRLPLSLQAETKSSLRLDRL